MKLKEDKNKNNRKTPPLKLPPPSRLTRVITVAATIAVLWITGYMVFKKEAPGEKIYRTYYEPFTHSSAFNGLYNSQDHAQAIKLYENGDYSEALLMFEQAIVDNPSNLALQFYYAMCHLELGNTGFAIADFQQLANSDDPGFSAPSTWYLGLAYVKAGQKQKAGEVFEAISTSHHPYKQKAEEIMKRL